MSELITYPIRVPRLGERGDIPDHELPLDALRLCQNMIRNSQGRLVIRDGYKPFVSTGPGGRAMGIKYFRTATGSDRTVYANRTQLWSFDGTTWTNRTGSTALAGSTTQQVRFAVMSVSGTYKIAAVNGANANQLWNGAAATFSDMAGSPPNALDATVAANRMLLVVSPDTIRISEYNDPETWPSDFTVRLVDAGDLLVGCDRLNRVTVAIYGDHSQYVARAQNGSFPFRFELIEEQLGPISPYVIVRFGGIHYYLAEDGMVYMFDGQRCTPIGGAMQNFVQSNLNWSSRAMSHGWYSAARRCINWLFPSGTSSAPDLGIYLNVLTGEMGRLKYGSITASAPWRSVALVTWNDLASYTWNNIAATYPTWDSFGSAAQVREILGDDSGQVHLVGYGDGSDNGTAIECIMETPLISGDPERRDKDFRPHAVETFFRKTTNSTTLQTRIGTTATLMSDRTLTSASNVDLNTDQRNSIDLATLALDEKSFVSLYHYISAATGGVEWLGANLYGHAIRRSQGPTKT